MENLGKLLSATMKEANIWKVVLRNYGKQGLNIEGFRKDCRKRGLDADDYLIQIDPERVKEFERERLSEARRVFAGYGLYLKDEHKELNPNRKKYEKLGESLERREEMRKATKPIYGGVFLRECPVCDCEGYRSVDLCPRCYDVYDNESLFWRQGKTIEE